MAESVIIYNSVMEQRADEFWASHPEIIVYGFYAVGILFLAIILWQIITKIQRHFYAKKNNFRWPNWSRYSRR